MRDIDQMVEDWHNGAGKGLELHEYLGMSWEEYKEQCVPAPQRLFEKMKHIRELAEINKKRDVARANPVDGDYEAQLNNAFALAFERYESALEELAKK